MKLGAEHSGALRLFVYYRVAPEQAPAALTAFRRARLESPLELLQSPGVNEQGHYTWMEIYPEGWAHREPQIAQALHGKLASARHIERFEMLG